jgi:PAS domain S-box-containing protein
VETKLLQLEQENARLKALLAESEEKLLLAHREGEYMNESEEKFRKLFQSHAAVKILLDLDTGNIVDANRAAADFYGWSVEDLRKMNIQQINPISVDEIRKNLEISRSAKQNRFRFRHLRSDGFFRDVDVFTSKIEIAGKELLYAIIFDITESIKTEKLLRDSELKFRTITEQMVEVVFVIDVTGVLTYVSPIIAKIFGYKPQEVIGHLFTEYLAEEEISVALAMFNNTLKDHLIDQVIEFRFRKKNGEFFFGEVHVHFFQSPDSSGMIGLIRDITERKRNEEIRKQYEQELLENGQFLKSIYEGVNHSIFVIDVLPDGSYQYMGHNPVNEKMTGISNKAVVGATPETLFPLQIARHFIGNYDACVRQGTALHFEENVQLMGKEGWWETVLNPLSNDFGRIYRIIGTATDITERKLAELNLFQLNQTLEERIAERTRELELLHQQVILHEKLASIGQLAAGIAHELNNPLNFIKINFSTQKEYFDDLLLLVNEYREISGKIESMGGVLVPELQKLRLMEAEIAIDMLLADIPMIFAESNNGFERMTTIINSMRNFSMTHAPDARLSFDVNQGIRDTLILARHEYLDIAGIETNLDEALPGIYGNPAQINQLFLNVIVNSAQAIKSQHRSSPGTITIHTWFDSGNVLCSIADDGPGIPKEIRKDIFNLFFSTKEPGKGIGLGLSICYDIVVHKHGGTLSVECPAEGGTVVTIGLPSRLCPVVTSQPE